MKNKKILKVVSVMIFSTYLVILVPSQVTFADENVQQQSESKEVTTQTLYWQCVEQDTGKVLKTIKADTVKVVNGVPEKKFFYMGHLPEKIGNLEIAGNPWGGRDLEVDPNNKSGVVYLKAGYWDAEAFKERSKNNFGWGDPKQQGIINITLMEYKAYHGTPDGYIAPGYYDDDNMSARSTSSLKSSKSKSSYKKLKIANKNEADKDKHEKHHPWIISGLVGIIFVAAMFFVPRKFWRKVFGGKGRHSK